jgi:hypothetical protein
MKTKKKHARAKHLQTNNQSTPLTQSTNQEKQTHTPHNHNPSIHPSIHPASIGTDQSIHQSKQERQARSLNENEKEACTRQTLTNKQSINITHSINQSRKTDTHATQSQSIHPSIHPSRINRH